MAVPLTRALPLLGLTLSLALLSASCSSRTTRHRNDQAREAARAAAEAPSNAAYRIGVSDTLRVEHRWNDELNRVVVVRPDGLVSLPLIADPSLAGLTMDEARTLLMGSYAPIVRPSGLHGEAFLALLLPPLPSVPPAVSTLPSRMSNRSSA